MPFFLGEKLADRRESTSRICHGLERTDVHQIYDFRNIQDRRCQSGVDAGENWGYKYIGKLRLGFGLRVIVRRLGLEGRAC